MYRRQEEVKVIDPLEERRKEKKLVESIKKSGKLRRRTFKSYAQRRNLLIDEVVTFDIPGK
jgi:hypothetical protein